MKLRPDWSTYLHTISAREIDLIFSRCPARLFGDALEIGAGDGYQSRLLARYAKRLTATDIHLDDTPKTEDGIVYRRCDAERLPSYFAEGQFDLVYSSNLLEHLPNPDAALRGILTVLREGGIAIHVMPSPLWKICHLALFYPDLLVRSLEAITRLGGLRRALNRGFPRAAASSPAEHLVLWDPLNNPKMPSKRIGFWRHLLWPCPHGVEPSHWRELMVFRKARWVRQFSAAGFTVRRTLKGPVSSPYGFGLDHLRAALERVGLATEYAFVLTKHGRDSEFAKFIGPPHSSRKGSIREAGPPSVPGLPSLPR